jgi:hypothetical protein
MLGSLLHLVAERFGFNEKRRPLSRERKFPPEKDAVVLAEIIDRAIAAVRILCPAKGNRRANIAFPFDSIR